MGRSPHVESERRKKEVKTNKNEGKLPKCFCFSVSDIEREREREIIRGMAKRNCPVGAYQHLAHALLQLIHFTKSLAHCFQVST